MSDRALALRHAAERIDAMALWAGDTHGRAAEVYYQKRAAALRELARRLEAEALNVPGYR